MPIARDERRVVAGGPRCRRKAVGQGERIERRVGGERVVLIGHRRVDAPLQQCALPGMRCDEHDALYRRHVQRGKPGRPSARRARDTLRRRQVRLLHIQRVQAAAARIAQQHHALEAGFTQEPHAGGHVVERELVLQARVVANRARRLRPRRIAGAHDVRDQVVASHEFTRVHDAHHGVGLARRIQRTARCRAVLGAQHHVARGRAGRQVARVPVRIQEAGCRASCASRAGALLEITHRLSPFLHLSPFFDDPVDFSTNRSD